MQYVRKFERKIGTATVEPLIPVKTPPKDGADTKAPDPAKQD